ncbi:MAG TPA: hypothetical protein VES60_04335 [Nakamurella sp.]|nr:hypothetical protein [Nakamurella sp.]
MTCRAGSGLNSPVSVDLRSSARGRALGTLIGTIALGTLIGTIAAPTKVLVSGEGVALASVVLDTAAEYARRPGGRGTRLPHR